MSQIEFSRKFYNLLWTLTGILVVFAIFFALESWRDYKGDYPREITVEAKATAFVVPDTAQISFGLITETDTVEEAVEENNKKMNKIMEQLAELGVEKKKIKTTNYSLNPKYNYTEDEGSFQDGYTLNQGVQVRLEDFELVGDVLSLATSSGANVVGGVDFVVSDMEAAKAQAREEAIANAKEKAENIADAAGLGLGDVINYWEYSNEYYYGSGGARNFSLETMAADEMTSSFIEPQIQPGEDEIELSVTLTYRLK